MDFAHSEKTKEWMDRVQRFMDTHVYPNEDTYVRQHEEAGKWEIPPIVRS